MDVPNLAMDSNEVDNTPAASNDEVDGTPMDNNEQQINTQQRDETDGIEEVHKRINEDPEHPHFYYKMDRAKTGKFYIFNQETFEAKTKLPTRKGTEKDKDDLKKTMESIGFDVKVKDDKTLQQIKDIIKKYTEKEEERKVENYFGCAILTHGEHGTVENKGLSKLWASDEQYDLSIFTHALKHCKSLDGKPKLFFIQACRGKETMNTRNNTDKPDGPDASTTAPSSDINFGNFPVETDFFFGYSTIPGYDSRRNTDNGSWYIQTLCYAFEHFCNLEFLQIMLRVNHMVAYDYKTKDGEKQMPSFVCRLIGEIRFKTIDQEEISVTENIDNYDGPRPSGRNDEQLPSELKLKIKVQLHEFLQEIQKNQFDLAKEKLFKFFDE